MQTSASVEIDRPIAEVFEYANNNVAEWSITVIEDEVIEEKPGRIGSTFRIVTEERGRKMEFQGETVAWKEPTHSAAVLRGQQFDIDVAYDFEDLGGGRTRITQTSRVHPKGFFKVVFFLMGWMFRKAGCKATENELSSLKENCEARVAGATAAGRGTSRADTA